MPESCQNTPQVTVSLFGRQKGLESSQKRIYRNCKMLGEEVDITIKSAL